MRVLATFLSAVLLCASAAAVKGKHRDMGYPEVGWRGVPLETGVCPDLE